MSPISKKMSHNLWPIVSPRHFFAIFPIIPLEDRMRELFYFCRIKFSNLKLILLKKPKFQVLTTTPKRTTQKHDYSRA